MDQELRSDSGSAFSKDGSQTNSTRDTNLRPPCVRQMLEEILIQKIRKIIGPLLDFDPANHASSAEELNSAAVSIANEMSSPSESILKQIISTEQFTRTQHSDSTASEDNHNEGLCLCCIVADLKCKFDVTTTQEGSISPESPPTSTSSSPAS